MDYQFVLYEVRTGNIITTMSDVATEDVAEGFEGTVERLNKTQQEKVDYLCSGSFPDLSPDTHYVEGGSKVVRKSSFPKLDTSRNGVIKNIPKGTVVMWPDLQETVENTGVLELESNVSGTFEFEFRYPKYFAKIIEVEFNV
tara:strand:- start:735 stop:1160 length:426 start_codon:yes stop_codon:yes gene_type:complete